jgi:hypothetical protein
MKTMIRFKPINPKIITKKKAVATRPLWERFCAVKWPKK